MDKLISVEIKENPKTNKSSHKAIFKKENGRTQTINFGSQGALTYIDGATKKVRENYIKRHEVREDWTKPNNAGSLSRWIKWGDSKSINKNISEFKKKFGLK